ncbi:MAG TPA: LacI family DNA-binding transcriptional regulator [Candidatus Limnocylindrales bacterium]|nr:LacI family DNA-binding transcriptional regulator [Candidatus Limnocylindrales bacterium]
MDPSPAPKGSRDEAADDRDGANRSAVGRHRPSTMKDIALATGVSRSTVSRILNDTPLTVPVAKETRERVLAAARDLDYRPNPLARALRGAPTMLLGAIVRDITDPFFSGAIEAISSAARARGYNIVLGLAHARATEAFELATVLEARQCDGIILLGDMGDQPRLLADLRGAHVPVVAMWQGTRLDLIPGVQVDNHHGIRLAVAHLRELGHRRIAFIGGRMLGDIRERQAAYSEAVSEILGEIPPGYVQHVANSPEGGEDAFAALLRTEPRPTAVVASTDVLAIGVLRAALLHGVKVPDQLSVVGFDDIPMATSTVPGLTTVQMPIAAMATEAVSLAVGTTHGMGDGMSLEEGPASEARTRGHSTVRVFPPTLVVRGSTGRAA